MRNQPKKRRGTVAVIVALSLVAVLSVVALALDGGILYEDRRDIQAAADAAALAAADDLFNNYGSTTASIRRARRQPAPSQPPSPTGSTTWPTPIPSPIRKMSETPA